MPTEEQLKQFDDIFNEPLSDRSKPAPPADYKPPYQLQGEAAEDYTKRMDKYNFKYYTEHKNI